VKSEAEKWLVRRGGTWIAVRKSWFRAANRGAEPSLDRDVESGLRPVLDSQKKVAATS